MDKIKRADIDITLPSGPIDEEDAIRVIGDLEGRVAMHQNKIVILRYMMGNVVHRMMTGHEESTYGKGLIDKLSQKTGIGRNILRVSRRLFENFIGKEDEFLQWVNDKKRHWQGVEGMLRVNTDPNTLGEEAHAERTKRRIERMAADLDEMVTRAQEGDEEAAGILSAATEEISRFREVLARGGIYKEEKQKKTIPRSEDYLDFVREQDCCLCGASAPSVPHHVANAGKAIKGSDLSCIPVCDDCHKGIHQDGHSWAESTYNTAIAVVICDTLHSYLTNGLKMRLPSYFNYNAPF